MKFIVVSTAILAGAAIAAPAFLRAQDPLKTLPQNYKLILNTPDFSVIRAHYGPHEKIPVHDHTSFATVFVYLSNSGPVRIDHAEQGRPPESVVRPPTTLGAYRVAPGIIERHSIENLSDLSSDFLRVELKHVNLTLAEPFRGKAPAALTSSSDTIEFSNPQLQIERIICVAPNPCLVKPFAGPSLLIAFTPANLSTHTLAAGAVESLPASRSLTITPNPANPTHILRILLPGSHPQ